MVFQFSMNYCGISFWGSKFMDVKGYPYPYIYVPTYAQQSKELSYIILQQTSYPQKYIQTNQQNFYNPHILAQKI